MSRSEHRPLPEPRRARVAFILVTLMLNTLGIGLVIPITPRLVGQFQDADLARTSYTYGALVASYAVMQLVFAPILGALSDRVGRRKVILSSLFGAGIDYLILGFAPTLEWLFLGRVVAGLTGASFSAATAYIADITPPEKRAQSFGLIGAAFGFGFILGPVVGGLLGQIDLRLPFFAAAGLNLLNFVYGLFVLPESLAPQNRRPFDIRKANPVATLSRLRRSPLVAGLAITVFCYYLSQQILQAVWALYLEGRFGWSAGQVGMSLAIVGLSTALVQGGLIRVLKPRLGERRMILIGGTMGGLGFCAMGFAPTGALLLGILVPFSLRGFSNPALQSLMTQEVSVTEQGELQGAMTSLLSISSVLGPLVGTNLLALFASETAPVRFPGAPFLAAGLLEGLGLGWAMWVLRRRVALPSAT
jgi:MFS transporter, DHA1 family, tetracycline resistance protein